MICLAMVLAGCSEDGARPSPTAAATTPTPTPVPTYTVEQAEGALIDMKDLGSNWAKSDLPITSFKEGKLRGCSNSKISLPGNPKTSTEIFGEPKYRTRGANYSHFIAVYPDATQATRAMDIARSSLAKCPASKKIPLERLPKKKFTYQHDDAWKLTEDEIAGWRHLRGFEKSVYPPAISNINVFYFSIDYAQRGNLIFSSIYWKRVTPKDSGEPIAEKATELLMDQLKRFG
ncbi:hypothetical protein ABGB12_03625 [Actinocorallia sp. B10E7]|uniref:hypothetical protein n=1 Tax=Actinocorallia sp. B10E7 TaxID=3153558 RepID=UPI00325E2A56